ncbi:DUF2161 family putative PD-(D/E)XK-type phosphodiesterase [bacterium]|nr:DUF2161 family putative PD-(D/E)XK-type phosphodiesterase [bacterium]
MVKKNLETDLYNPLYDYLVSHGYTVRSEVNNCDVVALKGDDLIIVELKKCLNVVLLSQAVKRQQSCDSVYVAVPRPHDKRKWLCSNRPLQLLLKRLELGLIFISPGHKRAPVEVIMHPIPYERHKKHSSRRAIIREVENRSGDFNTGGSCRTKIMTAYRENVIQIACYLAKLGPTQPKVLRQLGTGEKTLSILHSNFYLWFERVGYGLYDLSARGRSEIKQYSELAKRYYDMLAESRTD